MTLTVAFRDFRRELMLLSLLTCGYVMIASTGLQAYIKPLSGEFILGSLAVALSLRRDANDKQIIRFTAIAVMFALVYIALPAKTCLYIALSMAVLCVAATFGYRSNRVTFFSIVMMSPIFDYAASVFSFPIKLHLTDLAAKMIQIFQPGIKAEGNILVGNGFEFSVDTACMGLHMLSISMLSGLIIISWFARQKKTEISFVGILIGMLIIFLLNVLSNLIRIVCLVFWKIPPDNPMHEVIGIVCFTLYVMAPMLYIVPLCLRFFGRKVQSCEKSFSIGVHKQHILMNVVLLGILGTGTLLGKDKSLNGELIPLNNVVIPGYVTTSLEHRVIKLTNKDALVYIKPIAGFFSSDHQPMICWSGSGYTFTRIREKPIGGKQVYTATLENGNDHLYTAWWYDNGASTTISQVDWRWNALTTQQHYSIINVTSATPALLETEVRKMLLLKPGKRG